MKARGKRVGSAKGAEYKSQASVSAAPKARNIKARGKREARRPWTYSYAPFRPEGPKYNARYYALSGSVGITPKAFANFKPKVGALATTLG